MFPYAFIAMATLDTIPIRILNYKCFGEEGAGFDGLRPFTVLIGRNNSGKSSLLDLLAFVTEPYDIDRFGHGAATPQILITTLLTEEQLRRYFPDTVSGGEIQGNHWQYAKQWIGQPITWELLKSRKKRLEKIEPKPHAAASQFGRIVESLENPFSGRDFYRLRSDRDIARESSQHDPTVQENGSGTTTLIRLYKTRAQMPSELVEKTLLAALNKIFEPDASFTRIEVQEDQESAGNSSLVWEVHLEEPGKGMISLSDSGSGLKTILLVLTFLHLIPAYKNKELSNCIFGFEELENNLHPTLQRRLFQYLHDFALNNNCVIIVTTHSNIVIDLFARDPESQLIHVQHDGSEARVSPALGYIEKRDILDDLGIRASDLLQSNSVVWVEGPSDRFYFKKWLEIWTAGRLVEGVHYQCVPYGGSLHTHLSADDPEDENRTDDFVQLLRVNRNSIILIDSDVKDAEDNISPSKQRLVREIEEVGGMGWVTAGRTVENYIPMEALATLFGSDLSRPPDQFEAFSDYLEKVRSGEGNRFLRSKVEFASRVISHLACKNQMSTLDLQERLNRAAELIASWNDLKLQ